MTQNILGEEDARRLSASLVWALRRVEIYGQECARLADKEAQTRRDNDRLVQEVKTLTTQLCAMTAVRQGLENVVYALKQYSTRTKRSKR